MFDCKIYVPSEILVFLIYAFFIGMGLVLAESQVVQDFHAVNQYTNITDIAYIWPPFLFYPLNIITSVLLVCKYHFIWNLEGVPNFIGKMQYL